MAHRGDTKPLCQRAQAGVALIGVSLLPISDGKTLLELNRSLRSGKTPSSHSTSIS